MAAEELCADWPRAGPRGWASPDPLDQEGRVAPGHVRKLPFVRKRSLKNTGPALCASHVLSHHVLTGTCITPTALVRQRGSERPGSCPQATQRVGGEQEPTLGLPKGPVRQVAWAAGTEPPFASLPPILGSHVSVLLFWGLCLRHRDSGDTRCRCASHLFPILPSLVSHWS